MPDITYVPDLEGTGDFMKSAEMQAIVLAHAEKIKVIAQATAPVGDSGRYKASFDVEVTGHGGPRADRAEATVANTAPYAMHIEFGTSRMRGRHILLNAARIAR